MIYPNDIPKTEGESVWIQNPNGSWDCGYIINNIWYIGVDNNIEDIVCPYPVSIWKYFS